MKKIFFRGLFSSLLLVGFEKSHAQLIVNADGPGNTYELFNSKLAPGYNVVESPECVHGAFGRHITEVFDAQLNQFVFEFFAHVNEDNDRCINFDRQRIEIKTYDQSPDSLIGTVGEIITFKWKFRIPTGFLPSSSFTHIHQIKAVGGDEDQPIFTLTVRKGNPNKLELIHVLSGSSGSNKVAIVNLSGFEGVWVEATEQLQVGAAGFYSMNIKRVSDGAVLMQYSNPSILTIRADNTFIRPKWGIYRSLNTIADLRDESIRFNGFSIQEGNVVLPLKLIDFKANQQQQKINLQWKTNFEQGTRDFNIQRSTDGINFTNIGKLTARGNSSSVVNYSFDDLTALAGNNFYRIQAIDIDGSYTYSEKLLVKFNQATSATVFIFPNPVTNQLRIQLNTALVPLKYALINTAGKIVLAGEGLLPLINQNLNQLLGRLAAGTYSLQLFNDQTFYHSKFLKL